MRTRRILATLALAAFLVAPKTAGAKPPIYISFHWHMHQPVYWPYESVVQTADANRYGFSVTQVHNDRSGPYTTWPADAVRAGRDAGFGHFGAQVSLSGSLSENLDALAAAGQGFADWKAPWAEAAGWKTDLGNPRLDLVRFGYHHPLMPLVHPDDIRRQIALHDRALKDRVSSAYGTSKGMFPPETGFAPEIIPALAGAGVEWVIVDNIHFDRAHVDYPYGKGSNLIPPNPADQRNAATTDWVQLQNIWAGSKVSAPWGYQPHYVAWIDPDTGVETRIIAVPGARYEGNEDARGGFGALQYESVLSQYEALNTDDDHPMLIVLHHDGDNYGGGSDSYYHANWGKFIDWLKDKPDRFQETTIQDYLDRFPPALDDVIHVEPGSWAGADNGDPEFLKWNADPDASGYSPDRASWAVVTAGGNRVRTAQANRPEPDAGDVMHGTGDAIAKAWHFYLNAQTSCYWYWDFAEGGTWDSHPARAVNLAMDFADPILTGGFQDPIGPDVYPPQRNPYNPGGYEWKASPEPSDFEVWTYVYDVSDVASVTLHWRLDADGATGAEDERWATGTWTDVAMDGQSALSKADPAPKYLADRYSATIAGVASGLVHYWVEAADGKGNRTRTPIRHVSVGVAAGGPSGFCKDDPVQLHADKAAQVHWGVNGWQQPIAVYQPAGSTVWTDGIALETPMVPADSGGYDLVLGPFNDPAQVVATIEYVFHYDDGTWGANQVIPVSQVCVKPPETTPDSATADVPTAGEAATGEAIGPGADVPATGGDGTATDDAFIAGDGSAGGDLSGVTTDEGARKGSDKGCTAGAGMPGAAPASLGLVLLFVVGLAALRREGAQCPRRPFRTRR